MCNAAADAALHVLPRSRARCGPRAQCAGLTSPLLAVAMQEVLDRHFWDGSGGGYFQGDDSDRTVLLRMKEDYDGAEPSANSVAAENLVRLAAIAPGSGAGEGYRDRAARTLATFRDRLEQMPMVLPQMCCSLFMASRPSGLRQVVLAGRKGSKGLEALLGAAHGPFCPDKARDSPPHAHRWHVRLVSKSLDLAAWAGGDRGRPDERGLLRILDASQCRGPCGRPTGTTED